MISGVIRNRVRQAAVRMIAVALVSAMAPFAGAAEPYTWQPAVIKGGGYVSGISIHPNNANVAYMRTDMGGAYRLDRAADKWVPILDWVGVADYMSLHGVSGIALDPTDDNKVYLLTGMYTTDWGTNGAVLRSNDRGQTWTRVNLPFKNDANMGGRHCGERFAIDANLPSTLVIGTASGLLYKSTDSAGTWAQLTNFPKIAGSKLGVVSVAFAGGTKGQASKAIYAGVSRTDNGPSLFRSADGGSTWSEVAGRPETSETPCLMKLVRDADDNLLLIYTSHPDINFGGAKNKQAALYRYDTTSDKWTTLRVTKGHGIGAVAADPKNAKALLITSLAKWANNIDLWRSDDAGKTWKPIQVKRAGEPPYVTDGWPYPHWVTDIDILPDGSNTALLCGVPGAYMTTSAADEKQTWTFYNDGMEECSVVDVVSPPTGPAQVYSAALDLGGFRHDDLTVSPADFAPEMDGNLDIDFAQKDPNRMVRTGQSKPFGAVSSDAGVTWKTFAALDKVTRGGAVAMSADGATIVWSPNGTPSIHRSTDDGKTWAAIPNVPGSALVAADRVNADVFYALGKGELFRSTDRGVSFARVSSDWAELKPRQLVAHPTIEAHLLVATEQGLRRSTDGGATWSAVAGVESAGAVGFGKGRNDSPLAIYLSGKAGGVSGLFRSDDDGATWAQISDENHRFGAVQTISGDLRRYGRVYIGTNGRGTLVGDIAAPVR